MEYLKKFNMEIKYIHLYTLFLKHKTKLIWFDNTQCARLDNPGRYIDWAMNNTYNLNSFHKRVHYFLSDYGIFKR